LVGILTLQINFFQRRLVVVRFLDPPVARTAPVRTTPRPVLERAPNPIQEAILLPMRSSMGLATAVPTIPAMGMAAAGKNPPLLE